VAKAKGHKGASGCWNS